MNTGFHPRKHPRQRRSMATVDAIVEATARILEEEGLLALNTNVIAERAGVSIGSLYQYFPTKEVILGELIRRERQLLLEEINVVAVADESSFEKILSQLLDIAVKHQLARPCLARALEYAETNLPLDGEGEILQKQIVDTVSALFIAHRINDAATAARDVVAIAHGMIDAAGLYGDTDAAALLSRVKRAVMGYLGRV